jgi:hypothetical protein
MKTNVIFSDENIISLGKLKPFPSIDIIVNKNFLVIWGCRTRRKLTGQLLINENAFKIPTFLCISIYE